MKVRFSKKSTFLLAEKSGRAEKIVFERKRMFRVRIHVRLVLTKVFRVVSDGIVNEVIHYSGHYGNL